MAAAMRRRGMPMPRNGGQKLIQRRRARELLVPPRSCRRTLPLFMLNHDTGLRLRWDGQAAAINGFENFVGTAAEQRIPDCIAEPLGIAEITVARFAQAF